jgi:hypothetical protein
MERLVAGSGNNLTRDTHQLVPTKRVP